MEHAAKCRPGDSDHARRAANSGSVARSAARVRVPSSARSLDRFARPTKEMSWASCPLSGVAPPLASASMVPSTAQRATAKDAEAARMKTHWRSSAATAAAASNSPRSAQVLLPKSLGGTSSSPAAEDRRQPRQLQQHASTALIRKPTLGNALSIAKASISRGSTEKAMGADQGPSHTTVRRMSDGMLEELLAPAVRKPSVSSRPLPALRSSTA
mmetsp:Transcript_19967/g.69304  ORF Transcript_19967/g.69304 Transcript_19967/m.69304 type:complete len:214 (-) Transcript_19967:150-791(-)